MMNSSKNSRRGKLMIKREILIHLSSKHFAMIMGGVNPAGNTNVSAISDEETCDTSTTSGRASECHC